MPRRRRYRRGVWLGILVIAWGIQAIVTQSLLLREAVVLMSGSEFAWGVVLFAWLAGVAAGAAVGGRVAPRVRWPDVWLVVVLLALSAAVYVELWVFRGARVWLGVEPGELLPLPKTALAAIIFVSPVSSLVGLAFPLACCVWANGPGPELACPEPAGGETGGPEYEAPDRKAKPAGAGPLGNVYALESAGSLIGGALFSFWAVEHLAPIQTALIMGAITAGAAGGLLYVTACKPYGAACLVALAAAALLVSGWAGDDLNRRLVERRWGNVAPGYELRAETESKYQNLAIGEREDQFTLYCDGQISADFPDPYTFVPLAHFWMCQHPAPRHVLVLGGGAEGLLAEILRHRPEHVDYVEPDARQIELIKPFLPDADRRALGDERVTVHHLDARYFVKTQRDRFDLVIARLPEPRSALWARLYTEEFYRELRGAMTPRAVLCLTAAAAPTSLTAASADYLASIRATLQKHFASVTVGWGDPAHVLAATDTGLVSTDPGELIKRYSARGVQSEFFHPLWFEGATDWLDRDKVRHRRDELDAVGDVSISTDLHPSIYLQRLVLWERMTSGSAGGGGGVIQWLRSIGWPKLVATLVAITTVALVACRLRARSRTGWASGAIVVSIGTTGFATMALSIVWLFAFQNLYGYVYQRIGWIIALFMGGLVIGSVAVSRRSKGIAERQELSPYLWRRLIAVDLLLALLALIIPVALPVLGAMQTTRLALVLVEIAVSVMVTLTGVLGGSAFALAGGLQLAATDHVGAAAGSIDSADHAGACAGALLTGVLLVPVFGTAAAALLLVGMKIGSAVLLAAGRRLSLGP